MRGLALVHLRKRRVNRRRTVDRLLQHPPLAARQAIAIGRKLFEVARQRATEKRQRRRVRREQRLDRTRIGRSIRGPRPRSPASICAAVTGRRVSNSAAISLRLELAEPLEVRMSRIPIDANQA